MMPLLYELLADFASNFADMFKLGFLFPIRHVAAVIGLPAVCIDVRGAGKLTMRCHGSDASVVRQVFRKREYDLDKFPQAREIDRAYQRILDAGKTPIVIDAGANMGASAVWFAKRFPCAHVIAIEPEPGNAAICRRNIERLPNARLIEAALGGAPGAVSLSTGVEDWAFRSTRTDAGGVTLVTIPELVAASSDGQLFLVKIDIEGFESDVFATNVGWLDDAFVVMVEPHDWMLPGQGSSRAMQKALAERPFEVLISGENFVYVRLPSAAAA
jgi:FkbM family methyltransferase